MYLLKGSPMKLSNKIRFRISTSLSDDLQMLWKLAHIRTQHMHK